MQETWVRSLGQENPLEKGMAAHFSILAWRIQWTEQPGRLQSMGITESETTEQLNTFTSDHQALDPGDWRPPVYSRDTMSRLSNFPLLLHGNCTTGLGGTDGPLTPK